MRDRTDPDTFSQSLFTVHPLSSFTHHFFHLCHVWNAISWLPTTKKQISPLWKHTSVCTFQYNCLSSGATIVWHLTDMYYTMIYVVGSTLNYLTVDSIIGCYWPSSSFSETNSCLHVIFVLSLFLLLSNYSILARKSKRTMFVCCVFIYTLAAISSSKCFPFSSLSGWWLGNS